MHDLLIAASLGEMRASKKDVTSIFEMNNNNKRLISSIKKRKISLLKSNIFIFNYILEIVLTFFIS